MLHCMMGWPPDDSRAVTLDLFYKKRKNKKGHHLWPGKWRSMCCTVAEAKPVWMVVFRRIQRRLHAAGVVPDVMWGSVPGRSTQEASFLYDMYLDAENLEPFMALVDVKEPFPNNLHRLFEEVWRQFGAPVRRFHPDVSALQKVERRNEEGLYGVGDTR